MLVYALVRKDQPVDSPSDLLLIGLDCVHLQWSTLVGGAARGIDGTMECIEVIQAAISFSSVTQTSCGGRMDSGPADGWT